jgi:TonB family protein
MRPPRSLVRFLLALALVGAAPLLAQEEPLAAGSEGVPLPKKVKHVQPIYPQEALAQGVRGIVILDVVVDAQGKVESTSIVRSVPGLDEAAVAAARQWQYEPIKVNGQPMRPSRCRSRSRWPPSSPEDGIPELRQGVSPAWPAEAEGGGLATAEVTLEPDGRVGGARVLEGGAPWSSALLAALKTWRFSPPLDDAVLTFRVDLKAAGLQQSGLMDEAAPAAAAPTASAAPPAAPPVPAPVSAETTPKLVATGVPAEEPPAAAPSPTEAQKSAPLAAPVALPAAPPPSTPSALAPTEAPSAPPSPIPPAPPASPEQPSAVTAPDAASAPPRRLRAQAS